MKRYLMLGLLVLNTGAGLAQNLKTDADKRKAENSCRMQDDVATRTDSLTHDHRLPEGTVLSFEGRNYREYDGFLLDLDAMMQPHANPSHGLVPPSFLYNPFENYRTPVTDYVFRFRPSNAVTYGSTAFPDGVANGSFGNGRFGNGGTYGTTGTFFPGWGPGIPGLTPFGLGPAPNAPTLRSATFRLNNGWRLTTYGEYDADGYKVRNPSALPGQRNTFNGAFEMKSENGNFGIRIGVQRY